MNTRTVRKAPLPLLVAVSVMSGCANINASQDVAAPPTHTPTSQAVIPAAADRGLVGKAQNGFSALKKRSAALVRVSVTSQHGHDVPASGGIVLANTVSDAVVTEVLWGTAPKNLSIVQSGTMNDPALQLAEFLQEGQEYVLYVKPAPTPEYAGLYLVTGDDTAYRVDGNKLTRNDASNPSFRTPQGRARKENVTDALPAALSTADISSVMLADG